MITKKLSSIDSTTYQETIFQYWKYRYKKKGIFYWYKFIVNHLYLSLKIKSNIKDNNIQPCDILFIHSSQFSYTLGREKKLINKLKENGINIKETIFLKPKEVVKKNRIAHLTQESFYLKYMKATQII